MKRFLIILGTTLLIILGLFSIGYFYLQNRLKKDLFPRIKEIISKETDINVNFDDIDLSFSKLLRLKPTIIIKKLKVAEAIDIEKLEIELALESLSKKSFLIKRILINKSVLRFEENAKREVFPKGIDLKKLDEKFKAKDKNNNKNKNPFEELVSEIKLKELKIKNSSYEFLPYKAKSPIKLSNFDLILTDFVLNDDENIIAKLKLSAEFFGVKSSNILCKASLGPFNKKLEKLPINGDLSVNLKIKDLPNDLKKQFIGEMVRVDGRSSFKYNSSLQGDAFNTMSGSGKLKIDNLLLGKSTEHTITVDSTIPLSFRVNSSKELFLNLLTKDARISLKDKNSHEADLNLNSKINVNLANMFMQGEASGSLSGLEIEETLNCFTDKRKLISGIFAIQKFNARFAGLDAAQISKSFVADGSITIKDGSLYILKNITKYKDWIGAAVRNGEELTEKIAGQFVNLSTGFYLQDGLLTTKPIAINSSAANITGSGEIIAGKDLNYQILLSSPKLKTPIPVKITGTIEKPKIVPDLQAFVELNQATLVQSALKIGLNKLQAEAAKNGKLKGALGQVLGAALGNGTNQSTQIPTTTVNGTNTSSTKDILKQQLGSTLRGLAQEAIRKSQPAPSTSTTVNGNTL